MKDWKKVYHKVLKEATSGLARRYYRFRYAHYYGGIYTADAWGCFLGCVYCWARPVPASRCTFYEPDEVVRRLSRRPQVRLSFGEPTLYKEHLLAVLDQLQDVDLFILETNGLLLDEDYIQALENYAHFVHVRMSLKGVDRQTAIENTSFDVFEDQMATVERLSQSRLSFHLALLDVYSGEEVQQLISRLKEIGMNRGTGVKVDSCSLPQIEFERFVYYKHLDRRLRSWSRCPTLDKTQVRLNDKDSY